MEANFLVTHDPTHVGKAKSEVEALMKEAGGADFVESSVDGVLLLKTHKNPKDVIKKLKEACEKEPGRFSYTFKWVPIEKWCSSSMNELEKVMKELNTKISENESWKMDLGKRNYEGNTMDIIMKLTEHINKPNVDLKNPQKIIKIEIIGKNAGVSLLKADEYLDTQKMAK